MSRSHFMTRRDVITTGATAAATGLSVTPSRAADTYADSHMDIQAVIDQAHEAACATSGGKNADYIPFLANVPSDLCGVCAVTVDGQSFSAGDAHYDFAIESISKVFTMALVMQSEGPDGLRAKVGVDPTGMPFNSVMALEMNNGKPLSPLVNAGAI